MQWCREPRCSSRVRLVCRGTFWVATSVPNTVSTFKMECGTSLETLQRERASSSDDGKPRGSSRVERSTLVMTGNLGCLSSWPREVQFSIRVVRESLGLLSSHCRANRPHLGLCPKANVPLQGRQESRGCIPDSPRESGLISNGSKELLSPFELQQVSLGAH